jgi:integrase
MRGHIRKRARDTYSIILSLGIDPISGKRKQKWVTVKGTKKDADRELNRLINDFENGGIADSKSVTVQEWSTRWLAQVVSRNCRQRTVDSYESICRIHIAPVLGSMQLNKVRPIHVLSVLESSRKRGVSENTILHVYSTLRKLFGDAKRLNMISANSVERVTPPKIERKELDIPSPSDLSEILETAEKSKYAAVIRFLAFTGTRRGEALGLKWKHVNTDARTVSVVETLQRVVGSGLHSVPTKSRFGRRVINVDETTNRLLIHLRASQIERYLISGTPLDDDDFVFTNTVGDPLDPDHLSQGFKALVVKLGYPQFRLHDLRHAHAAGMISAGIHPVVIQRRLGHSSAAFTMDTYGHVSNELDRAAVDKFALVATGK